MTADERPTTNDNLPDGWVWTTLGEACEVNPTMSWPESFTKETPVSFVPMAAVDDVTGAIVAAESRPIDEVWRGYKRFAEGDVIFARITPCMENGKAAIATGLLNGIGLGSTEFHVLRPTGVVSAEWIYHSVRQQSFRNEAAREMTGTAGQLRVPKSFMEEATIPLPPLAEQQRIVAKMEVLFAQSRRGREALDAVPDLLAQFRQAVLAAAFRGELTERDPADEPASVLLERIRAERRRKWEEDLRAQGKDPSRRKHEEPVPPDTSDLPELPEGWVWTTVAEIGDTSGDAVLTGPFGAQLPSSEFVESGVPVLAIGNVQWNGISYENLKYVTEEKAKQLERYKVAAGDVLFTRSGTVGRAAVVPPEADDWLISYHLLRVRADFSVCIPEYLYLVFRGEVGIHERIAGRARGATRAGFNTTLLKTLPIPLAPLEEQRRIVARIEALFAQADILEAQVATTRRRLEQVDQAILARAFHGELVPQDPDDEPASVLLERIRREREAHSAKKQTQQMRFPTT